MNQGCLLFPLLGQFNIHISLMISGENNIGNFVSKQCASWKPWLLAFMWVPLDNESPTRTLLRAQPLMATAHSDDSGAPSNNAQDWHKKPDKELKHMASTRFNICWMWHNKSDPWRPCHGSAANALVPDTPRGPVSMPWWVRAKSESLWGLHGIGCVPWHPINT